MGQEQSAAAPTRKPTEAKFEENRPVVDDREVFDEETVRDLEKERNSSLNYDIYQQEIDIINYGNVEEEKKTLQILLESKAKEECKFIPQVAVPNLSDKSKYKFIESTTESNSAQLLSNGDNNVFIKLFLTDFITNQGRIYIYIEQMDY